MNTGEAIKIFQRCIVEYHELNAVEGKSVNSFSNRSLEYLLYEKCWTDNIQWHLEDIIRDPDIDPVKGLEIKRKIDRYNQQRTDIVEQIDDWFVEGFKHVKPLPGATLNTETLAWALDRLSILQLKIWHMQIETERPDVSAAHRERCRQKHLVLKKQEEDLSKSIQQLLEDIAAGRKIIKVYRQFKMYNDESLNPFLNPQKNKS